jgi:hypothetical protein
MNVGLTNKVRRLIDNWSEPRTRGIRSIPIRWVAVLYLAGIVLAEILTTFSTPQVGLALHALLFMLLLVHAAMLDRRKEQAFLLSLSLAPLIRLLSLSMPLTGFPFVYWYMIIGIPLFLASIITIRVSGLNASTLGLNFGSLPVQLLVGASGVLLGFVEYLILRPAPIIPEFSLQAFWLPALILLVFTGFLEELIFRGLMQYTALRCLGRLGLIFVSLVFAALHIGYRSLPDVVFVFLAATFFALVVRRTGSLLGVSLAHGLTNITLFLIFPLVM